MSNEPSRKQITHDRIVEVAARAIRRAGYHGVGVADIMKEAGLTHGGFYAHFGSRDALLVEAMQHARRDTAQALNALVAENIGKGMGRFAALVEAYLDDRQMGGAECGCAVAALAGEMPRQGDAVLEEARESVRLLIDGVGRALPEGTQAALAPVVAATMVGALQLARTLGGKAGKAVLASTRKSLVDQYEPGRSG
ncbi:TetR/AcrR family transcriptional regulator [Methylibium rhizosphaerae]|uniref:TetR/AcrR family transcriptional regulator n=1 Tax=Methylibium rhizosphaerae TaxID=2570323 RepID=UPI001FE648A8|nr:TetR/AcrR family transcriptional regulator [Methylibium rhizosphaerae]